MAWAQFNKSIVFAAQIHNQNNKTETPSIASPMFNADFERNISHRQVCIAIGKNCGHCGLFNHFAKVCREKQNISKNTPQCNRAISLAILESKNNSEEQNASFFNYNKQYDSKYDFPDNHYAKTMLQWLRVKKQGNRTAKHEH